MGTHSENVTIALLDVKNAEQRILDTGMTLLQCADGHMYVFDLFAIATLNRGVAISSAFHSLASDANMVAAGALVRIHLDTAIRYYASHLVSDWNEFAEAIIRGERIDKLTDRNGKKLSDFHLSSEFEQHMPGARDLYERACGYVHFSHVHTASVLNGVVDSDGAILGIKISATDRQLSDRYYMDACNTIIQISEMIVDLVHSWIEYKVDHFNKHPQKAKEQ